MRFVGHNPSFDFHLSEYIEASNYLPTANASFASFCGSFAHNLSLGEYWNAKREVIRSAVRNIAKYDNIDWDSSDYWTSIPQISKDDLRMNETAFLNPKYKQHQLWLRPTSGTSGSPVSIWYAPDFFTEFQLFGVRKIAWLAGQRTNEILNHKVLCLAVFDNKHLTNRVWGCPENSRGLTLRVVFDERNADAVKTLIHQIQMYDPAIVALKPNILESIILRPPSCYRPVSPGLRLIISSGAELSESLRLEAQKLFGITVVNAYGMSEFGGIASECERQNGLHIYENSMIPEVRGEDGCLHETGHGELVLSSVANSAMPLLRYRTGDLVEITNDPCACGLTGNRIRSLSGKMLQNFRLLDGSELSPTVFDSLFRNFSLREFRITQSGQNQIIVEVEFLSACTDRNREAGLIKSEVEKETRNTMHVTVLTTTFVNEGKFQRYRRL